MPTIENLHHPGNARLARAVRVQAAVGDRAAVRTRAMGRRDPLLTIADLERRAVAVPMAGRAGAGVELVRRDGVRQSHGQGRGGEAEDGGGDGCQMHFALFL